jgi:hypothetical protein
MYGIVALLGACLSFSLYANVIRKVVERFPPLVIVFWAFVCGGSVQIIVGLCLLVLTSVTFLLLFFFFFQTPFIHARQNRLER